MDIEAELQKLVGQRVTVDQAYRDPQSATGILVDAGVIFTIADDAGQDICWFGPERVEYIHGYAIVLKDPAEENETPPDYPTPPYEDPRDEWEKYI